MAGLNHRRAEISADIRPSYFELGELQRRKACCHKLRRERARVYLACETRSRRLLAAMVLAARQAASRGSRGPKSKAQGKNEGTQDGGKREICEQPSHDREQHPLLARRIF